MTKRWKTIVEDGDIRIALYLETSEGAIECDLEAGGSGSFILERRREFHRANPTRDIDHADLAAGAFACHRDARGYTQSDLAIEEVDAMPSGLRGNALGGHSNAGYTQYAVTVYEDRQSTEQGVGDQPASRRESK